MQNLVFSAVTNILDCTLNSHRCDHVVANLPRKYQIIKLLGIQLKSNTINASIILAEIQCKVENRKKTVAFVLKVIVSFSNNNIFEIMLKCQRY